MVYKIFVDGSGWNGVNSAYCVILDYGKQRKYLKVFEREIQVPEIEYLALIAGLELAEEKSIIYSDSKNVIKEVNLKKKPKNLDLFKQARKLMEPKNIKVLFILRSKNKAGWYLEQRLKKTKYYVRSVVSTKRRPLTKKQKYLKYGKKKRRGK